MEKLWACQSFHLAVGETLPYWEDFDYIPQIMLVKIPVTNLLSIYYMLGTRQRLQYEWNEAGSAIIVRHNHLFWNYWQLLRLQTPKPYTVITLLKWHLIFYYLLFSKSLHLSNYIRKPRPTHSRDDAQVRGKVITNYFWHNFVSL